MSTIVIMSNLFYFLVLFLEPDDGRKYPDNASLRTSVRFLFFVSAFPGKDEQTLMYFLYKRFC